jgi:hypothetical protein
MLVILVACTIAVMVTVMNREEDGTNSHYKVHLNLYYRVNSY